MTHRVAVIGGGSSGLACIKCCLDEGLEPVCFESSDDIGGLWRFKVSHYMASIYHSLIINTSKERMCFSDFPIPAHFPNFMHNSLIMDYFRMYADHFQLTKHIRFNTKVLQVKQRSDFSHSGQWDVETEDKDGKKDKHIFDAVLICIGHHCHPNMPLHDFPGINTFTGRYFHSRDYKTPEEWRNKKAIVVGIGNSGGDIAVELSRVTKQVYLSTRRGAWIKYRMSVRGFPLDMLTSRVQSSLLQLLPFGLQCSMAENQMNQRIDHICRFIMATAQFFNQHPTVNDELPNRILSGTVMVKPNIRRFQGSSVEFDDGSVVEDIDLVVFATGYKFSFPFLTSQVVSVSENKASLYKYVFPPELDRPTLAIIGLVQPLGSTIPVSEMQARWATRVFKGQSVSVFKSVNVSTVHGFMDTQCVDYVAYMDEIAELVGVKPALSRLLLTDPRLGLNVMFGPTTPCQYRLRGPGKWAGARQAILTQWERVAKPMQTRICDEPKAQRSFKWPLILSVTALALAVYVKRKSFPSCIILIFIFNWTMY
uniref:Flavin-containing monooxygenase n=1 Tax=Sphaeramia orbicularis TaxID=375764 RepID=A0A673ACW9_9TELE